MIESCLDAFTNKKNNPDLPPCHTDRGDCARKVRGECTGRNPRATESEEASTTTRTHGSDTELAKPLASFFPSRSPAVVFHLQARQEEEVALPEGEGVGMAEGDQMLEARRHPGLLLYLRGRQEGEERGEGRGGRTAGREEGRKGEDKSTPEGLIFKSQKSWLSGEKGGGLRWRERRNWRREGQSGRKRVREGAPLARRPRQYLPRRPGVRWASEGRETRKRGDGGEREARETFGRGEKEVDTPT